MICFISPTSSLILLVVMDFYVQLLNSSIPQIPQTGSMPGAYRGTGTYHDINVICMYASAPENR